MRYILQTWHPHFVSARYTPQQKARAACTLSPVTYPMVTGECTADNGCANSFTYQGGELKDNVPTYYNDGAYTNIQSTMSLQGFQDCGGDCGRGPCRVGGAGYKSPKIVYFPLAVFRPTKSIVSLTTSGVQGGVCDGSGDDQSSYNLVLVPWGNIIADKPDPSPSNQTVIYNIDGTNYTLPLNAQIVAQQGQQNLNGHGLAAVLPNFDASMRYLVQPGKKYALAIKAMVATDDKIRLKWGGGTITQSDV
jgi:hypothetical protein